MTARSVTFGSGPASETHIHVDDEYCSPTHCRITQDTQGRWWAEDLGSTNGTWVRWPNMAEMPAVGRTPLLPGSTVRIGRTTLPWEAR